MKAARQDGMAGATVLKGIAGFGSHGVIGSSHWKVVEHVPVIVEIVDLAPRIVQFISDRLAKLMLHGEATLERANVMMYRQREQKGSERLELAKALAPLSTMPQLESGGRMTINQEGVLLRVFIGESDRFESRPLHEATMAFGRIQVYSPEAGCVGAYQACIGFVTARDAGCTGPFQRVAGAPNWQATIYVWRDTSSNEMRLRCDPSTTFPATTWPPPTLESSTVIGTRMVAVSFAFEPAGSPAPTSVAVAVEEQVAGPSRSTLPATLVNRTVFVPQN